jgi:hypothetical protein
MFYKLVTIALIALIGRVADAGPVEVTIVSTVGATDIATDAPKRAKSSEGVTLYALLRAKEGRKTVYFSDAKQVRIRGKVVKPRPMSEAPAAVWAWYKVEPALENMSNTETGKFRFETIAYGETPYAVGRTNVSADVRPTLTTDRGGGFGTMRFRVKAAFSPMQALASPGANKRRGRGSGGLSDKVHRVSLRPDDTYVGFLSEMYGQPYIWASGGKNPRVHQSERLEGSDCADFVTYGWRRMGNEIPYTWSEGLREFTRRLASGSPDDKGIYRDAKGKAIPFPKVGDLVLFPRHVGVLVEDRGSQGVLDAEDLMFHTLFTSPQKQSLGESMFGGSAAEILRWRE